MRLYITENPSKSIDVLKIPLCSVRAILICSCGDRCDEVVVGYVNQMSSAYSIRYEKAVKNH